MIDEGRLRLHERLRGGGNRYAEDGDGRHPFENYANAQATEWNNFSLHVGPPHTYSNS
jgi:hypothetical protein